jgi:hypothetical protein
MHTALESTSPIPMASIPSQRPKGNKEDDHVEDYDSYDSNEDGTII